MYRRYYAENQCVDQYVSIKERDNKHAAEFVNSVSPSMYDWIKAASIGNVMNYGVRRHDVAAEFTSCFNTMFAKEFAIDDSAKFLPLEKRVVYFTDTYSEAMFDKKILRGSA